MMSRIQRARQGRSAVQILRLIGLNLIYATRRLSPGALRERRRDAAFDRRYGTDTSAIHEMSSLEVPLEVARHGVRYQPANVALFKKALSLLALEPWTYVFVDYGSGKGRVLLLASLYPFKKIIGVEISRELADIARNNARLFCDEEQQCSTIQLVVQDARDFEPPMGHLVCFLYNPFDDKMIAQVVDNLERSLEREPRPIWVIYQDPVHRNAFDRSSQWVVVYEEPSLAIFRSATSRLC